MPALAGLAALAAVLAGPARPPPGGSGRRCRIFRGGARRAGRPRPGLRRPGIPARPAVAAAEDTPARRHRVDRRRRTCWHDLRGHRSGRHRAGRDGGGGGAEPRPALRHLAADEAGMAYLAETRPEAREKALIGLVPGMDDETVAALPAMVTALPGTDEQEQSLTGVLVDVRRHLRGDPLALDRALVRAGKVRWQSQYDLAEHVTSYARQHPELARLATAIAETRWSSGAGEPARGT
ncbi:hypothetical protein V2I01_32245 [Micromonospora sp. BRA006-A]|nr:hypothetical protein [Micromonospora sp. BRA006-A]